MRFDFMDFAFRIRVAIRKFLETVLLERFMANHISVRPSSLSLATASIAFGGSQEDVKKVGASCSVFMVVLLWSS
ncbi:unnamed protein product [Cylicocyclus nassatus]|uniref:Uncharacterized protein n=1 Tax=Cylicocyclus nassatus TaxID=53992 RepID=A0AA36DQS5_CYLNA|nr:unnamed protein product [Cylicocyclus nassatus]